MKLDACSHRAGRRIYSAAGWLSKPNMQLEAWRRQLHNIEPISREWYSDFQAGMPDLRHDIVDRGEKVKNVLCLLELALTRGTIDTGPMPWETWRMTPSSNDVAFEFIRETRGQFQYNFKRLLHCLDQLRDEDLWWRPHESANSIQNVIFHLCGNLRQWIIHGLGGEPDIRNRPQEFADRRPISKAELIAQFKQVFDEVDAILGVLPTDRLLEPRRIQGYEMSVLGAIMDTVTHFIGHTHQVVYISRMRLGDAYRFFWEPENPEQTSSR